MTEQPTEQESASEAPLPQAAEPPQAEAAAPDEASGFAHLTMAPSPKRTWKEFFLIPAILFVVGYAVLSGLAWDRVGKPSSDPHFTYLANAFLDGQLNLARKAPHGNDWASYEWMKLRSGQEIKGVWRDRNTRRFETLDGQIMVVDRAEVDPRAREKRVFVSFPPAPAVLIMPLAAIWGYNVDDVSFTIFFGALNFALMFIVLRRFSDGGRTGRTRSDNLWLTVLFGAGTVHLWCAVLGQVWFSALVIGATFTLLYILASIDARHPLLAGICLAIAFSTRTPLLFSAIFFMAFIFFPKGQWRREGWPEALKKLALFCLPCLLVGLTLLYYNYVRFESFTEFGHSYLAGGQIGRIRKFGLFNIHFLSKNLSAALTLLPRIQPYEPFVVVSRHGMSLLLTTPVWIYLFRPMARRTQDDRFWWGLLWATVAVVAIPGLFYQNTGYEQFGYRFSLDYTPYMVLLLAVGRRPLSRWFKALVIFGIAVNTFGAITFKRFDQFYMPGSTFFDPD